MSKRICGLVAWFFFCAAAVSGAPGDLASAFLSPPDSARPWVFWFWLDGNTTREGITADLESMHRVGIGGVVIMEVDAFIPKGPVRFMTPRWREMFQHVLKESSRLGIEIVMNNDGGWMGSGGPWIKPELAMQMTVWSETRFTGGRRVSTALAQPKTNEEYYRDIAVFAFPTPAAEAIRMAAANPKITWGSSQRILDVAKLADGNAATVETLPALEPNQPHLIHIDFPQPFTARALTLAPDRPLAALKGVIAVSDDGKEFRNVREFNAKWPTSSVAFGAIRSRHFLISLSQDGRTPETLPLGELELVGGGRIDGITGKAAYVNEPFMPASAGARLAPDSVIPRSAILDLTTHMDSAGRLTWEAPAGDWTVMRIGHTPTGKKNHPSPLEGIGLECDKLNPAAIELHFAAMMGKLIADQEALGVKSMTHVHVDSWEAGSQNWTPRMREEFRKRNSYDLFPFLLTLTGRVVDNQSTSERFLWDLRHSLSEMANDYYVDRLRELCHQHGVKLSVEPYGNGPVDDLSYGGRADPLLTEFWNGRDPWWGTKMTASAVHTYGRQVLGAEAFTSRSPAGKWQAHPFRMKPLGDQMFAAGVNHFVFHRFAMQPWMNRYPGMTMGPYGIEFERTVTWWEQSKAYLQYVARCQHMLQQGRFIADIGYVVGEKIPYDFHEPSFLSPEAPSGYDYDVISSELLAKMVVRDGRAVLPSGMSYRVLVLPAAGSMRASQLRQIKALVEAGATVVGPPPTGSPSLAEGAAGDAEVRRLAREMWGDCDGINLNENRLGKGKVVWGKPFANVLNEADSPPDFSSLGVEAGKQIRYVHRSTEGKEIYFVASAESQAATFLCTFRVAGKKPQLWWPDSGRIERVAAYDRQASQIRVPIRLDAYGSVFVVFSDAEGDDPVVAVTHDEVEVSGLRATTVGDLRGKMKGYTLAATEPAHYRLEVSEPGLYGLKTAGGKRLRASVAKIPEPIELTGQWEVNFPKGWGAPERIVLDRLASWTAHPDDGVKHFSGTAVYRRKFTIPTTMPGESRRLYLDLGHVAVIAEVTVNGQDLGILWKPPFRVDITGAARAGENDLEVRVVNLWANRLIGDEQLPEDADWNGNRLKAFPQWFLDGKPSPTGRFTFMTWRHWNKEDALLESGLIGPVRIEATETIQMAVAGSGSTVETIVGGGKAAILQGVSTEIGTPTAVAVDGAGNVHFALTERRAVWRLDGDSAVATRIVGASRNRHEGDNGPASNAFLSRPSGIAIGGDGTMFIADPGNGRVRKISNGIITTVAGDGVQTFSGDNGPAANARVNCPAAVAVDAAGDLYIADWGNHRVRKVSKGIITTVAGNGTDGDSGDGGAATDAQLRNPAGVAVDADGNLYISDTNSARVRKVSKGIITTFAGNGAYGIEGDGGSATSAKLSNPTGLAVDSDGSLYIADTTNARIRKVSNGVITTVAGSGVQGYSGDNGPATGAQFNWPRSIAIGPGGELYIADTRNGCVRKVTNGRVK